MWPNPIVCTLLCNDNKICFELSDIVGEPMAQILAIDTSRAEQIPLRFSLRTTYRDL